MIAEIELSKVLSKFDGKTFTDDVMSSTRRLYSIARLPKFLILHIKRFRKNEWFTEKNPTIVRFPIMNLDMRDYLEVCYP